MLLRGRVLAVVLTVIMMLTFGLMMLAPASAGAFPGKNGEIAFSAWDASLGYYQIYVMNPDGTDVKELTLSTTTESLVPAWSPDGAKIAYENSTAGPIIKIWVMNADGSGAHQLTSGTSDLSPSWSPDGSKIAFSRGSTGWLYVVNADGTGTPTQLTSAVGVLDGNPSWSPDGTKIAFDRMTTSLSPLYLYILTVATLSVTQLLTTTSMEPCWSPDGSQIVFIGPSGIYVVSANGGTAKLILSFNPSIISYEMPNWSPDGTKIAFDDQGASILVMNADGSNPTDVTPSMPTAFAANWQPLLATPVVGPVGGFMEPVNKLAVFAPYLTLFGMVAAVAVVVAVPWKRRGK